jgi:hypothetical protein
MAILGLLMKIKYYPDFDDIESSDASGSVKKLFNEIAKHSNLFSMVKNTLDKVKDEDGFFDILKEQGKKVRPLKYCKNPIYEFRIPPTSRKGGVVRLYFGHVKSDYNTIYILSGEIKHDDPNENIIKQADERYKEVCL